MQLKIVCFYYTKWMIDNDLLLKSTRIGNLFDTPCSLCKNVVHSTLPLLQVSCLMSMCWVLLYVRHVGWQEVYEVVPIRSYPCHIRSLRSRNVNLLLRTDQINTSLVEKNLNPVSTPLEDQFPRHGTRKLFFHQPKVQGISIYRLL